MYVYETAIKTYFKISAIYIKSRRKLIYKLITSVLKGSSILNLLRRETWLNNKHCNPITYNYNYFNMYVFQIQYWLGTHQL